MKLSILDTYPNEILFFLLLEILKSCNFSNNEYISSKGLNLLIKRLKTITIGKSIPFGGALFYANVNTLYISKDHRMIKPTSLKFNQEIIWENSFKISISQYDKTIPFDEAIKELKKIESQYKAVYGEDCYKYLFKCKIPGYDKEIYLDTNPEQIFNIELIKKKGWVQYKKYNLETSKKIEKIPVLIKNTIPGVSTLEEGFVAIPYLSFQKKKALYVDIQSIGLQNISTTYKKPIPLDDNFIYF